MKRELCEISNCNNLKVRVGYRSNGDPSYSKCCSGCNKRGLNKRVKVRTGKEICMVAWCNNKALNSMLKTSNYCNSHKKPYTRHKKEYCERCEFKPEDMCQLDVDHIDNDHGNSDPSNLQTLCANCHRLKTFKIGCY